MTGEVTSLTAMTLMYAKAYGIYFIATGLAIFLNPSRIRSWYEGILHDKGTVMLGGTIALVIGSFILATHHIIVPDWRIIITLIGYWGVVAGTAALVSTMRKLVGIVCGDNLPIKWVTVAFGGIFSFKRFNL